MSGRVRRLPRTFKLSDIASMTKSDQLGTHAVCADVVGLWRMGRDRLSLRMHLVEST